MDRKFLINCLFELGVHLGSSKHISLSTSNFFIVGNRHGVDLIDLKKSVFFLKKTLFFLKELGNINGKLLIHHSNLYSYNIFIKLYLVNLIVNKAQQSFFDEKWSFGQLSNFRVHAVKMVNELFSLKELSFSNLLSLKENKKSKSNRMVLSSDLLIYNKSKKFKFLDLLLRILFLTYLKYMNGINWDLHFDIMKKYWRFVLFFKFFNNFSQLPDVFIFINPNHYHSPLLETSRLQIPIVSLVDTDSSNYLISYPIFSNDDSIILVLFYFQLFVNSYMVGAQAHIFE